MSAEGRVASGEDLKRAVYYCVREDFNAQRNPKFIDGKMDGLIRAGLDYFEKTPASDLPEMNMIELLGIDNAARRRGINLSKFEEPATK